jgi:hypothetical protein
MVRKTSILATERRNGYVLHGAGKDINAPDRYLQSQRDIQPVRRDGYQPGDRDTHDVPEEKFFRVSVFIRQDTQSIYP